MKYDEIPVTNLIVTSMLILRQYSCMSQESSRLIYCLIHALSRHSTVLFDLAYLMGFSVRRGAVQYGFS